MIVRKPGVLLATCNCLQSLPLHASQSSTSPTQTRPRRTRPRTCTPTARHAYASIAGDAENTHNDASRARERPPEHVWPHPPKGHSHPTPYQIFALQPGAAYSKARFYELVKIYHPDIHGAAASSSSSSAPQPIPHAVKVERYRLIVAAHAILSDPAKRSAYDRFGAGWNGRAEAAGSGANSPAWPSGARRDAPGPFTHSWGATDPGDPIWQNATWEDWERYYARRAQEAGGPEFAGKRAPVYMANSYFLAMVVALAIVGSSFNYGRAQDAGTYFVEQRDLVHDRAAKELRRVRQEASSLSSRQDRIEFFVRQREATMGLSGELEALREERAERVLPDKEICASEELRERDV